MNLSGVALFVYIQRGCPACAKAKSELAIFKETHPSVIVTQLDVSMHPWQIAGVKAKATPQYIAKSGSQIAFKHEGVLTAKQLTQAIKPLLED
jgi:hypothetical protein